MLLVALLPLTRILAGTAIGPLAAAVPLSIAGVPWFADDQPIFDPATHPVIGRSETVGEPFSLRTMQ